MVSSPQYPTFVCAGQEWHSGEVVGEDQNWHNVPVSHVVEPVQKWRNIESNVHRPVGPQKGPSVGPNPEMPTCVQKPSVDTVHPNFQSLGRTPHNAERQQEDIAQDLQAEDSQVPLPTVSGPGKHENGYTVCGKIDMGFSRSGHGKVGKLW